MVDKYLLSTIFLSAYDEMCEFKHQPKVNLIKTQQDYEALETALKEYIKNIFCFKFDYTPYLKEVKKYMENIILNSSIKDFQNLPNFISKYTERIKELLNSNQYSSVLIDSLRDIYSSNGGDVIVSNVGNMFRVEKAIRSEEEYMPSATIHDINELEKVLKKIVFDIKNSSSFFKKSIDNTGVLKDDLLILFKYIIKNASTNDLLYVEKYLEKYDSFITDDSFDELKKEHQIGQLFGYDLFARLNCSTAAYETPYYLKFFIKIGDEKVSLPNVRLGITSINGVKHADILATQTSQSDNSPEFNDKLKPLLKGVPDYRNYNPAHVVSIILAFGLLNKFNIKNINIIDYLPLRLQSLITDCRKSKDELDNYQFRLTNKNLISYLRACEYFEGISITTYPDLDGNLSINLGDIVKSDNQFVQQLYEMGYSINIKNEDYKKL